MLNKFILLAIIVIIIIIIIIIIIMTSAEGRGYAFYLCLFVRLSMCPLDYSKSYERILMKFFWKRGEWPNQRSIGF